MSIKQFVNTPELWNAFLEECKREIDSIHKTMEYAENDSDRLRLQGEARAVRRFEKLRDIVNYRGGSK